MQMPLRAFWTANGCVTRLSAEREMRLSQVIVAGQAGGESLQKLTEAPRKEQGQPTVTIDNRRDQDATMKLKKALSAP